MPKWRKMRTNERNERGQLTIEGAAQGGWANSHLYNDTVPKFYALQLLTTNGNWKKTFLYYPSFRRGHVSPQFIDPFCTELRTKKPLSQNQVCAADTIHTQVLSRVEWNRDNFCHKILRFDAKSKSRPRKKRDRNLLGDCRLRDENVLNFGVFANDGMQIAEN